MKYILVMFIFLHNLIFMCVCMYYVCMSVRRGIESMGANVTGNCELSDTVLETEFSFIQHPFWPSSGHTYIHTAFFFFKEEN